MSKQIPLTQGKFAIVDDEDFERVNQFRWTAVKHEITWYAHRNTHKDEGISQKKIYLHRFILCPSSDIEVDHIDGDGLNCRRSNMRLATSSQNKMNRDRHGDNVSGYKGVYLDKRRNT